MKNRVDHIILISLDTLRGDSLGGNKYEYLPKSLNKKIQRNSIFLDELAQKSLHFTNCFTSAPFTTASHASIFTGFLPLHHGVFEYFNSDMKKKTIFEYAKTEGYKTIFQTDFPVILGEPIGFKRGVDNYYIEDEYHALEKLKQNIHSKTLSFFHFGGIHYPYGFHTLKFGGDDYRKKIQNLESKLNLKRDILPRDRFDETYRQGEDKDLLFRYKNIVEHLYKNKDYNCLMRLYFEGIDYFVKHRFRQFFNELEKVVDQLNHLIVIFGDHGEEWSDESKGHYKSLSVGVLNVPLLVMGPDIIPGIRKDNVRTVDIAPTVLDSFNIKMTESVDGSILDLYKNRKKTDVDQINIAQVWLGVGKQELISHIEGANDDGFTEKMQTVKRGESIIQNDYQLLRKFDKKGVLETQQLLTLSGKQISNGIEKLLLEKLETYNRSAIKYDRKTIASNSLKAQLESWGYKI